MTIINFLDEFRNRRNKKNNITNLFEEKLNKNIDEDFEEELFLERIKVFKAFDSGSLKAKQQRLISLENIEKKYFNTSNNFEDKVTLLSYQCMMSDRYCVHLVSYIKNNIETLVKEEGINWTIGILKDIDLDNEKIVDLIKYLKNLKEGKAELDYGGNTPPYSDIQSSISVGSEYNFQKA